MQREISFLLLFSLFTLVDAVSSESNFILTGRIQFDSEVPSHVKREMARSFFFSTLMKCYRFSADPANAFSFYEVFCEQYHLQSVP